MFGRSDRLPPYLNPRARSGSAEDRQNVQRETGGDIAQFKRDHVILYNEKLKTLEQKLKKGRHGVQYVKMNSSAYRARMHELVDFADICRENDVIPYVGGGATEEAMRNGTLYGFAGTLQRSGVDTIEVSNSGGEMRACSVEAELRALRKDFTRVLVEIGTKRYDCSESVIEWEEDLKMAMDLGADNVILEGTGSGDRGIYDGRGWARGLLVAKLLNAMDGRTRENLIVEAPHSVQRSYWANDFLGWRARFGNVRIEELAETARLRLDAMHPAFIRQLEKNRALQKEMLEVVDGACRKNNLTLDDVAFNGGMNHISADDMRASHDWREKLEQRIKEERMLRSPLHIPEDIDVPPGGIIMVGGAQAAAFLRMFFGR